VQTDNWLTPGFPEVREVLFKVKNTNLEIRIIKNNGELEQTDFFHETLKVTGKSGDEYMIDITGAQYGFPEKVTPFDWYKAARFRDGTPFYYRAFDYFHRTGFDSSHAPKGSQAPNKLLSKAWKQYLSVYFQWC